MKYCLIFLLLSATSLCVADVDKFEDQNSSATVTIAIANIICPSGFRDSYWELVDTSTKTFTDTNEVSDWVYHPTKIIPGHIGNIQICPDNGLLRLKNIERIKK